MRKKTLRRLLPATRRVARLANDLASIERKMKNLLPILQELEIEARALEQTMPKAKRN